MCGIVGLWSESNLNNEEVVRKMMSSIKHRGPDDEGLYSPNHNITFGHVRLSIIDIYNGKQPMHSFDSKYTIIFNGEIYNYIELKQSLIQKGIKFRTGSDTEVILAMYQEYGEKMLKYLNGMFAFCIYNKEDESLFIARDHFGIKPLYYTQKNGLFVFASEIKALLTLKQIKAEIDEKSLHEYLTFQMVLKKHSLFKNIYKLEPGNFIIVKNGVIKKKEKYWSIDFTINSEKTEEQFSDELKSLLDRSLSIQMRSDVPVGTYLSGGLDSSAVTILASKYSHNQIKTFTGAFKESEEFDETKFAKIVAKAAHADQNIIYPNHSDFLNHFEKIIYMMDEPCAGPGVFSQYMVSKLASEHVKVILGGQGGDEVFGGYVRYAIAYLEQCLKGAIFETQEEGKHIVTLNSIINNLPSLKKYVPLLKKQFSSGLFESMDKRYFQMINRSTNLKGIYTSQLLESKDDNFLMAKFSKIFNSTETLSYFNKMTHFDMETLLPSLLHVEDRVSMSFSIESRVPLLDKKIVELAATMPPNMKFAGGKIKSMLVKSLKNTLPKEILNRKDKMGFPTPLNNWLAGPLKEYTLDTLKSQAARNRGFYKIDEIEKSILEEKKFSRNLWGALNLEVWAKTFIDAN